MSMNKPPAGWTRTDWTEDGKDWTSWEGPKLYVPGQKYPAVSLYWDAESGIWLGIEAHEVRMSDYRKLERQLAEILDKLEQEP